MCSRFFSSFSLSPAASFLVHTYHIDVSILRGTGKRGMITKEDVIGTMQKEWMGGNTNMGKNENIHTLYDDTRVGSVAFDLSVSNTIRTTGMGNRMSMEVDGRKGLEKQNETSVLLRARRYYESSWKETMVAKTTGNARVGTSIFLRNRRC